MQDIQKLSQLLQEIQDIACATHEAIEKTGLCPLRDFETGLAGNHRAYDAETRLTVLWQLLVYTSPRFELQARFQYEMSKNTPNSDVALIVRQIRSSAPRIVSYRKSYDKGFAHTDFGPTKHNEMAADGCLFADGRIAGDAHIYAIGWMLSFNDKIFLICADEISREEAFSAETAEPFPKHSDDDEFWSELFMPIIGTVYQSRRHATLSNRVASLRTAHAPEAEYARFQALMSEQIAPQSRAAETINAFVAEHSAEEIADYAQRLAARRAWADAKDRSQAINRLAVRILRAVGCDETGNMPHAHRAVLAGDPAGLLLLPDDLPSRSRFSPRDTIKQALDAGEKMGETAAKDAFEVYMRERRWLASFPCVDLSAEDHAMKFGIPYDGIRRIFSPELMTYRAPIAPQGDVLKQFQTKFGDYMPESEEFPTFEDALSKCMSRQFSRTGNMSQIAQWIYKVCDRWRYCKSQIEMSASGPRRSVNKATQSLLHKGLSQLADMFKTS